MTGLESPGFGVGISDGRSAQDRIRSCFLPPALPQPAALLNSPNQYRDTEQSYPSSHAKDLSSSVVKKERYIIHWQPSTETRFHLLR